MPGHAEVAARRPQLSSHCKNGSAWRSSKPNSPSKIGASNASVLRLQLSTRLLLLGQPAGERRSSPRTISGSKHEIAPLPRASMPRFPRMVPGVLAFPAWSSVRARFSGKLCGRQSLAMHPSCCWHQVRESDPNDVLLGSFTVRVDGRGVRAVSIFAWSISRPESLQDLGCRMQTCIARAAGVFFLCPMFSLFVDGCPCDTNGFVELARSDSYIARGVRLLDAITHSPVRCAVCGGRAHTQPTTLSGEQKQLRCWSTHFTRKIRD